MVHDSTPDKQKIIFRATVTMERVYKLGNNALVNISFYCPARKENISKTVILKPIWNENHKEKKFL